MLTYTFMNLQFQLLLKKKYFDNLPTIPYNNYLPDRRKHDKQYQSFFFLYYANFISSNTIESIANLLRFISVNLI